MSFFVSTSFETVKIETRICIRNDGAGQGCQFAVPLEEVMLCQYYMKKLFEFCNQFHPPIPRSALVSTMSTVNVSHYSAMNIHYSVLLLVHSLVCVQGTAAAYYKRFYMQCSVMEHHPKDIL